MTELTQIMLIAAVLIAVVVVAILFRNRARRIEVDVDGTRVRTAIETHDPAAAHSARPAGLVSVKDSVQAGTGHRIDISRGDVEVERHKQKGKYQDLTIAADHSISEAPADDEESR